MEDVLNSDQIRYIAYQLEMSNTETRHLQGYVEFNEPMSFDEALELCNLKEYSDFELTSLSGGQCQRAYLALTIAQKTKIILLDEPTTFLDINFQLQMLDLIKTLYKKNNLTIVSVLHDINLAIRYCDRLAVLKEGKLLTIDEPIKALSKEIIRETFSVESQNIDTPVGEQICAIKSINN